MNPCTNAYSFMYAYMSAMESRRTALSSVNSGHFTGIVPINIWLIVPVSSSSEGTVGTTGTLMLKTSGHKVKWWKRPAVSESTKRRSTREWRANRKCARFRISSPIIINRADTAISQFQNSIHCVELGLSVDCKLAGHHIFFEMGFAGGPAQQW